MSFILKVDKSGLISLFFEMREERTFFMKNMIETKELSKKFKRQYANDKISMTVRENTIYGLLGPNGAGKSTLLKLLTGMLNPTSGEILFAGKTWERRNLLEIGALIETPPLYENLSAYENLKVRALLYGVSDERINEVLEIVSLQNTGEKKAGQFSLGMKQRLGIAIALLNRPKLLILDEPTNGLDPIGIGEMRQLIRSFPDQGITVILSSHMLSEVEQIVDDIGIIAGGKLWYEGAIDEGDDLETLFMEVIRKAEMDYAG